MGYEGVGYQIISHKSISRSPNIIMVGVVVVFVVFVFVVVVVPLACSPGPPTRTRRFFQHVRAPLSGAGPHPAPQQDASWAQTSRHDSNEAVASLLAATTPAPAPAPSSQMMRNGVPSAALYRLPWLAGHATRLLRKVVVDSVALDVRLPEAAAGDATSGVALSSPVSRRPRLWMQGGMCQLTFVLPLRPVA